MLTLKRNRYPRDANNYDDYNDDESEDEDADDDNSDDDDNDDEYDVDDYENSLNDPYYEILNSKNSNSYGSKSKRSTYKLIKFLTDKNPENYEIDELILKNNDDNDAEYETVEYDENGEDEERIKGKILKNNQFLKIPILKL